jgi:2-polyprenyl-3-methyl-5-hydroxy-6-metoxy-1,4-benzoquinol methylase
MPIATDNIEYVGYFEARGWDKDVSEQNFWYYDDLNRRVGISAGAKVLDVGFGDGRFLDWCAHCGILSAGVEILKPAIAKAKALGHDVVHGPLQTGTFDPGRTFDLIACFDVIEHLTTEELRALLTASLPHLAKDGRYLFRFPNGSSPFVGPVYGSDPTHRSLLTPEAIAGLVKPFGLMLQDTFNDRILPKKGLARFRRRFSFALRALIERVVCIAYFGTRMPLDPNVFVLVGRAPKLAHS